MTYPTDAENNSPILMTPLIQPPPDLAIVIDKLASYVIKNGLEFEEKILEKERNNPKFSFLLTSDPYYLWYRHRLGLIRKGEVPMTSVQLPNYSSFPNNTTSSLALKRTNTSMASVKPDDPKAFIFTNIPKSSISKTDFDIINLVARYNAISLKKNDSTFLNSLKIKECSNPQFDFLQPTHSLNPLFQDLTKQYQIFVNNFSGTGGSSDGSSDALKVSNTTVITKSSVLNLVNSHVKWRIWNLSQEDEERKKKITQDIDWDDFVLTETIDYPYLPSSAADRKQPDTSHHNHYPPILDVEKLNSLSISDRRMLWEGDFSFLEDDALLSDPSSAEDEEEEEMDMGSSSETETETEAEVEADERSHDGIKVVHGYRPSQDAKVEKVQMMESCPICFRLYKSAEIAEHIRIESLDPKWAEQRARYLSKHQFSNLSIDGTDVVKSLRDARRVKESFSNLTDKEIEEKISKAKKETSSKTIQWDGK